MQSQLQEEKQRVTSLQEEQRELLDNREQESEKHRTDVRALQEEKSQLETRVHSLVSDLEYAEENIRFPLMFPPVFFSSPACSH